MKTISVYRMVKRKWGAKVFDGDGAKVSGGRWNSRRIPCVYASGSESLALLEVLVHLQDTSLLSSYAVFELRIPEYQVSTIPEGKLPPDWQQLASPQSTAMLGDEWLKSAPPELALAIPSAVVPREMNYLLNVAHPEFQMIISEARELPFRSDSRLVG